MDTLTWATQELRGARLGDARRTQRLIRVVAALARRPTASVPEAHGGDWAATKATYRLWASPRISPAAIRAAHRERTLARLAGHPTVLAVQDTTELDFTPHPATAGLGPLDRPWERGLKVHSALAVSTAGVPLGLLHQQVWARDPAQTGQKHQRKRRPTAEKESQRWLDALAATQATVPEAVRVVTIADQEGDIYDLFALPRRPGSEFLIRACHDRCVDHPARRLWAAIRQAPPGGTLTVEVPRADDRPGRRATLTLRWLSLGIEPPQDRAGRAALPTVPVQVLLAEEAAPPPDTEPICWLLVTTLPIGDAADARRCVRWYTYRWRIERYHFVLKSGCRVEALQLGTAERLERALATYCIVAWRLLWLTYQARETPEASCEGVLARHEWQALWCTVHRPPVPPAHPPSLGEAVRLIARLGGFLGRRGDGAPGVKTLWRGWRRLEDIAATWLVAHAAAPPQAHDELVGKA